MQLFISPEYQKNQDNITITDERIIHQCVHVLRYKPWQLLQLQDNGVRYMLSITSISKKEIQTMIQEAIVSPSQHNTITVACALPNRRDKAELIIQKCTEIGSDQIIFWKADRSILHELPEKKLQRFQTIALESSEQSFRRSIPTITYLDNLLKSNILTSSQIIFFHQDWKPMDELSDNHVTSITAIVGPEWGFSSSEYEHLSQLSNCSMINLGQTILRMETAAIIWSRLLKNL